MHSRQINFFIDEMDYAVFDELVRRLGGAFIALPLFSDQIRTTNSLLTRGSGDWLKTFIYRLADTENIIVYSLKSKIKENKILYGIDDLRSNVIEFERCYVDTSVAFRIDIVL